MLSIKFDTKPKDVVRVRLSEEKTGFFNGTELVIGIGKKSELTARKWLLVARQVVVMAKQNKVKEFAIDLADFKLSGEQLAMNFEMANYEFKRYKTLPDERVAVESIIVAGTNKKDPESFTRGQIIAEEVNRSRTLANTPGGDMTPTILAEKAKEAAKNTKVTVRVLGRDDMKILKMGGVLGVAQGSAEAPQFIVLEYFGAKNNAPRPPLTNKRGSKTPSPLSIRGIEGVVVLVGKGITFDSGGLNLKPGDYLNDMHLDMSGGATVIHSIVAAAQLGIKRNIVGLIPAVENMPSGSSYRPGDVLKTMSGQTIEVGNTDAEGRVVLADALTYAEQYKPKLVIDIATLTGAAEAALGQRASAIFSKDEKLLKQIQEWGESSGDYVWPLPLWSEYEEEIKGTFGDWSNTDKTRWGGAIHGAIFLYQFAKKYPWVHIDMAPRMLSIEGEYLAKGSAGAPIRLLIKVLEEL